MKGNGHGPLEFSAASRAEVERLLPCYPQQRAALIPVLHLAQREFGHISEEVEQYVAKLLGLPVVEVHSVVTFYTLLRTKPVGRYHLQVCRNLSCALRGGHRLINDLCSKLGIAVGETTPDGRFTLSTVECLGGCDLAPMMQINDDYWGHLTRELIDAILVELVQPETQPMPGNTSG